MKLLPRLATLTFLLLPGFTSAAERKNVLLLCVDDLKPLLGCYGDTLVKSPAVDRLAARSVLFRAAYCNQAVCAPSRNSLLTGLRPQTLGIYDLGTNFRKSRPDALTLPQHFKANGYRTEALGKILHTSEDAVSWSAEPWKPKAAQYALKESNATVRPGNNGPRGAATESADVPDDTFADGLIAAEAIQRLTSAKDDAAPFFLAVGFMKPHLPFVAPKKYWDLYNPAAFNLSEVRTPPEGAPDYAPQFGGELRQYADMPEKGAIPDDLQRRLIHGYYAATSYTDAQIGRVLDALDRLELSASTIVILWGDHGWHLGDHGMWCKHTNYEEAARIPLLVSAPGLSSGVKTVALTETVDLYPTLCELAGLPVPAGLDGRSFLPVLKDPAGSVRDHITHVYPRNIRGEGMILGRAIRTARHRLVEWKRPGAAPETAALELYDYQTDPLELRNLATDQPEIAASLRALLTAQPEALPQLTATPKSPTKKSPDKSKKPTASRDAMFDKRDADKDGCLTLTEFLTGQPDPEEAPKRFPKFDTNHDGTLSRDEFVNPGKR